MTIDNSQLHPLFRPSTSSQKKEEDRLKSWKAVFYTLRSLTWKEACKNLRRDGIDKGYLVYDGDGEPVTTDGLTILQYFDEHKKDFNEAFDRAFTSATIDEMVQYAKDHYGLSQKQIMDINDERMAQYRKRENTKPYHSGTVTDAVADEQKRKGKQKKQSKTESMPWDEVI